MLHTTTKLLTALGLGLACLISLAPSTVAQDATTGTVIFSSRSVALGIGVSWGDGVLTWQGKTYVFTLSGLSVADLGIARVHGRGEVKNLKRIEDFAGNYLAAGAGGVVGGGAGVAVLRNQNGVEMALTSTGRGVRFTAAGGGVEIRLK